MTTHRAHQPCRWPGWAALLLAAVPAAWLVPNHYLPWLAAWSDGWALAMLAIGALALPARSRWSLPWVLFFAAAFASLGLQWITGAPRYAGDVWIAGVYLLAFATALHAGQALCDAPANIQGARIDLLACGVLAAATLSVAIALLQWTQVGAPGLYEAALPPGGRPFGNLGQPNHLCTAAFMGLAATVALFESGRIGRVAMWVAALFMLLGMVLSGSRTGWLQVGLGAAAWAIWAPRIHSRLRRRGGLLLLLAYFAMVLAWHQANAALALDGTRSLAQLTQEAHRRQLWSALLQASLERPWLGFGWQQVADAQWAVALKAAPLHRHFEHAHNLLVDLVIWAGWPLAVVMAAAMTVAIARPLLRGLAAPVLALQGMVLGLLIHAMLEMPHSYAYFLLPAGLALGIAGGSVDRGRVRGLRWSRWLALPLFTALVPTASDYLQAESNHRLLRLESARIGTDGVHSQAPNLLVLTQLEAFLRFARTPAQPGMTPEQLQTLRDAARRFAYPPSMLRLALAQGLNGQPEEASRTLRSLCAMHPPPRCDEARRGWTAVQQRWPVLLAVPGP